MMSSDSENSGRDRYGVVGAPLVFPDSPSSSLLVLRSSSSPSSATSSATSLAQPSSDRDRRWLDPDNDDDDDDHEGGLGSSARSLVGGASASSDDRAAAVATTQRWSSSSSANIYENVPNSSDQPLGHSAYGKLRACEENIYENICEDCGRLYGAGRCGFCDDEPEDRVERTRRLSKYSAKFQEFLGSFRIKPSKSIAQQGKRKLSRSDIVHNVGGFEDVYRTNKSFDLGEICRMRDDERSTISNGSSNRSIVVAADCGDRGGDYCANPVNRGSCS